MDARHKEYDVTLPAPTSMSTLVSILIPCFNAEQWVAQAIESALAQTWPAKEVIVVDDGSSDRSLEIIRRFGSRIRWETGPNRGGNNARNRLLELARGQWVQYLDADDYLLPDKIAHQMQVVLTRPDVDVVFSSVITIEYCSHGEVRRDPSSIPEPHDLWSLLASCPWGLPQTGGSLWRKQAIFEVSGWKPNQPCCQEQELYLRLLIGGKRFAYCPTHAAVHRRWSTDTVSRRDIRATHRHRLDIEQRLQDHLRETEQLTPKRLRVINLERFRIARIAWQYDPSFAARIMDQVRRLEPQFLPEDAVAPARYRLAYRYLGFRTTEKLAGAVRKRAGRPPKPP